MGGRLLAAIATLRRNPLGAAAALGLAVVAAVALFGSWLWPGDPYTVHPDDPLVPPVLLEGGRWVYPLGTDHLGRDVLARLLLGARVSLSVGVASVAVGSTLGAGAGLIGGFAGGRADLLLQRLVEGLQSIPGLVLALAVVAMFGQSSHSVAFAVGLGFVASQARVMRGVVLAARQRPYVEAAFALGASPLRVLWRHLLPNCLAPFVVLASAELGTAVLTEASLGFLGLGVPPPEPSWGSMLAAAQEHARRAPWLALIPGLALSLLVLACNLLGDAVRDALDPRLRRG